MINVKMRDIIDNIDFFTNFSKKSMPAKLAFQTARILDTVVTEYNRFNAVKDNLIKEFGERDENGELIVDENGNYQFKEEAFQTIQAQLTELLETEIQIYGEPLHLSDLEEQNFTPGQMYSLKNFIIE